MTGFLPVDNVTATYSRTPGQSAGLYIISAMLNSGGSLGNYTITYNTAGVTIGKAVLTVTANSFSRPYGTASPALSASITGFVNNDPPSVVGGAPALNTLANQASLPAAYPIAIGTGTLAAANYTFNLMGGTLTVTFTSAVPASDSTCNGAFSGTYRGNLEVTAGQNCIFIGGGVTGNVEQDGGNLALIQSKMGGDIQVQEGGTFMIGPGTSIRGNLRIQKLPAGSTQNQVCGTTVQGDLQFKNNATAVLIGSATPGCAGNKVGGNLQVQDNAASTIVDGNTVTGKRGRQYGE